MHPALPPHTPFDDHPAGCWCGQDGACAPAGTPRSLWQARRAFLLLGGAATASAAPTHPIAA